jgi:hypothetical protein
MTTVRARAHDGRTHARLSLLQITDFLEDDEVARAKGANFTGVHCGMKCAGSSIARGTMIALG